MESSLATQNAKERGQNLANSITTRLRTDIVSGRRPPGSKLSIDRLKGDFGVSLSPLREALARLAAEGFIVNEDKKGFRVEPVSRANLEEIATLQATLEPMAVRESLQRGDTRWEELVVLAHHRLVRHERPEHKDGGGVDEWEARHRDFHLALLAACGMPMLVSMCESLQHFSARYRRLFLGYRPFDREVAAEHRAILGAVLNRQAGTAHDLLKQHIERTARNILDVLK